MAVSIMENVPFLEKIWNKYKLDDDLGNDGPGILPLCNIFHLSIDNFAAKKIDICTKLLRNLKVERNRDITNDGVSEYCYYIYYWLYYNMKVHNIPVVIIDNILDESFKIIKRKNNAFLDCSSYMLKDGLREPEDLVMLRIFTNEIDVTKEILNNKCKSKICSCNEFIKPFVDSYRNINNYCPNGTITGVNMITCLAVKSFKDLYERKRSSEWKEYKLPDLSSSTDENINIEGCVSQINGKELSLDQGDQLDSYTGSTTLTERVGKIVPTTLGTIAGVSSVLALLYKFTPLGSWINIKILGKNKLLENMKKNEQEFLSNSAHTRDINSGDMIYRIKYNSLLNE